MVQPGDATARALGLQEPPREGDPRPPSIGQLFTVALFSAGRKGCECESCAILTRIQDLMTEAVVNAQGVRLAAPPPATNSEAPVGA